MNHRRSKVEMHTEATGSSPLTNLVQADNILLHVYWVPVCLDRKHNDQFVYIPILQVFQPQQMIQSWFMVNPNVTLAESIREETSHRLCMAKLAGVTHTEAVIY